MSRTIDREWGQKPDRRPLQARGAGASRYVLHLTLLSSRHEASSAPHPAQIGFAPPPLPSPFPGSAALSPGRHRSCRSLHPARPSAPDTLAAILEAGTLPTATRRIAPSQLYGHFRPPRAAGASSSRERREVRSRPMLRSRERDPGGR